MVAYKNIPLRIEYFRSKLIGGSNILTSKMGLARFFSALCQTPICKNLLSEPAFAQLQSRPDQEIAVWYNDNIIYPDKVRLNCYYYRHYYRGSKGLSSSIGLKCLMKDLEMIFATVLGRKVMFGGEEI